MWAQTATCRQTVLYNGKISTMDARLSTARSIVIDGDRIAAVGMRAGIPPHESCARLIDLKGRRVVPGLIDSHNHIVQVSLRPGHDVRIEIADSIADMQKVIGARAANVPAGEWITSFGGWSPSQFAEKRMPTATELDVVAAANPVYLQTGFDGPASTNSLGIAYFKAKGVEVGPDGKIGANAPTIAAFRALDLLRANADAKRGATEVMAYAASVGLTMSDDKGEPWPADTAGVQGLAEVATRTNAVNPFTGYDQFLELNREGKMAMRLRIFFYMQDLRADLPFLKARLNNQFRDFGNDWIKVSGMGERVYSGPFPMTAGASPDIYESALRLVAEKGWALDQHAMGLDDEKKFIEVWERVNKETPLAGLRWCLAHVPGVDSESLRRLQAIGAGVSAAGGRYTASIPPRIAPQDIPPFRRLIESGVHVGYGSDGGIVAPLNPWPHMYYMVTGKNNAGELVAAGQTISRVQALQLYTSNQPWFTKEEDSLGSLEVGKLADVVVLSADFLDAAQVPDEQIKRITSVLTIVGGRVVYENASVGAEVPQAAPKTRSKARTRLVRP